MTDATKALARAAAIESAYSVARSRDPIGLYIPKFVEALAEQGFAIVPVEPTGKMQNAGYRALRDGPKHRLSQPLPIYKAMIRAATDSPDKP